METHGNECGQFAERSAALLVALDGSAQIISYCLERLRCTQSFLALILGVTDTYISSIKKGKRQLSARHVAALAVACSLTQGELYWLALQEHKSSNPRVQELNEAVVGFVTNRLGSAQHADVVGAKPELLQSMQQFREQLYTRYLNKSAGMERIATEKYLGLALKIALTVFVDSGVRSIAIYELVDDHTMCLFPARPASVREGLAGKFKDQLLKNSSNAGFQVDWEMPRPVILTGHTAASACFSTKDWCSSHHKEVAIPVPTASGQRRIVIILAGPSCNSWTNDWCHDIAYTLLGETIGRVFAVRAEAIVASVARAATEAALDPPDHWVQPRLDEHTEARFDSFLRSVASEVGEDLFVADFWALDRFTFQFYDIVESGFAFAPRSCDYAGKHDDALKLEEEEQAFKKMRPDYFCPKPFRKSFVVLLSGRPWVAMHPTKNKQCLKLGKYIGIPLDVACNGTFNESLISGVLFLRFRNNKNKGFRRPIETVIEITQRYDDIRICRKTLGDSNTRFRPIAKEFSEKLQTGAMLTPLSD